MKLILIFLITCLLMASAWPAYSQELADEVRVTADIYEYVEDTDTIIASGNVRVVYHGLVLTAHQVTANLTTQEVTAQGNVTVTDGARQLQGDRAVYNLETRVGEVTNGKAVAGRIIGSGERIAAFPDRIELYGAAVTTCVEPKPDYEITARRIILVPGRQLRAEKVSFVLFGRRILTIPGFRKDLTGQRASTVIPKIGSTSISGIYAAGEYQLNLSHGTDGILDIRLSQKQFLQGGIKLDSIYGSNAFFWATVKEEVSGRENISLLVDRLPYTGLAWGPVPLGRNSRFLLTSEVSAGYFRERPTDVTGWRSAVAAKIQRTPYPLSSISRFQLGLETLAAVYDNGDSFGYVKPEVGFYIEPPYGFRGGFLFIDYISFGKSPFQFDQADVLRELRPRIAYNRPKWEFGTEWRYDLDKKDVFDTRFSFTRRFNCVSAELSYETRRRNIGLDFAISGLGSETLQEATGSKTTRR